MKKFLLLAAIALATSTISLNAQQDEKTKVKKTTTVGQKVHNTFSKKKKHKGYKIKHQHANGIEHKKKVNQQTGEVKKKTKND